MVNADFLARAGLGSADLVYWYASTWSAPVAGTATPGPIPIRKGAAAVAFISNATGWLNLDGLQPIAVGQPSAFLVAGNWTPVIGLELGDDLPVAMVSNTAGAFITMLVFRRRRQLERLPGQV